MSRHRMRPPLTIAILAIGIVTGAAGALASTVVAEDPAGTAPFPPPLESYGDSGTAGLLDILRNRIEKEPFNLWATLIFLGAIGHTFLAHRFRQIAHALEDRLARRLREAPEAERASLPSISPAARLFHFFGEVEVVFGIWVLPLLAALSVVHGASAARAYISDRVNFTEAVFVVVIMSIASTRPILRLTERILGLVARLGGGRPIAWWFVLLTVGPVLGSIITEPAAMTLCAMLLSRKFFDLQPGNALKYATLGLLFVAVSVGGTLTHFAAPPVLMVAGPWGWDTPFMLSHFGWKAVLGIGIAAAAYLAFFHKELRSLSRNAAGSSRAGDTEAPIPAWVTVGHVLFLGLAVVSAHFPIMLILAFMFFLAFTEVTEEFQRDFSLRAPVLVGFFLAGLVIHGGLQQWWIAPVLGSLAEVPLMIGATVLTAFNDNAAITYLCTLVPTFTDGMKYAALAGAVTGGGLTVIANAPNPAGQSILGRHFEDGIAAAGLFAGALIPTVIVGLCFMLLR